MCSKGSYGESKNAVVMRCPQVSFPEPPPCFWFFAFLPAAVLSDSCLIHAQRNELLHFVHLLAGVNSAAINIYV